MQKALRHFLLVRGSGKTPPYLVIMDDIRKDGQPADYTWLWHIPNGQRFQCSADRWSTVPLRLTGSMLTTTAGKAQGSARFTFTAPSNGVYTLTGLVRAGGADIGKSDSFWISVNGGKRLLWALRGTRSFGWEPFTPQEAGVTNTYALHAGETFNVHLSAREPEAQLSKLALVPQSSASPDAPDENPAGGATLTADDAQMLSPPFLKQRIPASTPVDARLTVFPATTDARLATNRWFATSREGNHPRLEHSVKAVEPRFLMVLVPGTSGTPLPQVRRLDTENGVGAEVVWNGVADQFLFGEGNVRSAGIETDGRAVFIRRTAGSVSDWALMDGARLTVDGQDKVRTGGALVTTDSASAHE